MLWPCRWSALVDCVASSDRHFTRANNFSMFEFIFIMDSSDWTVYDCFDSLCRNHGKFQWIFIKKPSHLFWIWFVFFIFFYFQVGTIIGTFGSGVLIHQFATWHSSFYVFGIGAIVWFFFFVRIIIESKLICKINHRLSTRCFISDMLVLQQTYASSVYWCNGKIIFGNWS